MPDQTIPPPPPGFTLDAPTTGPVYGAPRLPSPQTPAQAQSDQLGVTHLQQQIDQAPLQNQHTQAEIAQAQTQVKNTGFDNVNTLRKQFEAEQPIQDYKTVLPLMDSAIRAQNNKAGDLNIVYAFGKVMDPGSVVREGEQVMATNVGGVSEKVKGYLDQIAGQGQLTPIQRTQLIEEIRSRARAINETYNQRRAFYEDFAKRNGINPEDVVGPHPGQPFTADERAYISAHGGTPRDGASPPQGRFGDDYGAPGTTVQFKDEQGNATRAKRFHDELYNALASKQLKSPAQINAWVTQFNQQNGGQFKINWKEKDTRLAIRNAMTGKQFGVETPADPAVKQKVDQYKSRRGTGGDDAYNVGAEDAVTVGAASKIAAAGAALRGSLSGDGSFGDLYNVNLDANREYTDSLRGDHPVWFGAGELTGGLALPAFGARTPAQLARVGLGYGATYGAMQGDSSTSLADQAGNAAEGGAAGMALGYAVPKALGLIPRRAAGEIPPLVDPATGELNTPMNDMPAAARLQAMQDAGLKNISPGMAGGRTARILEQGFNNLPGSAGLMEDFNSGASKELRGAMQGVAQKFGTSKTLSEGGAELQRGASERIDRGRDVIGKAYSAIPIADNAPTSTANTVGALQQLTERFQSNPELADALKDPKLLAYLNAVQKGLSWKDMKDFRSVIGEKIGDMRFGEGHSTSDLRALYGALSQDMRDSAAAQGPRAIHAFERANNLYRQNEQLIQGALTRILGKDGNLTPERAAAAVQAMTKGGKSTGDLRALAQIKSATVKSGAWDEIASTMIHLGGQPANSEGRAFSPQTFVQWYSDMAEPARAMLFKPELRKALDNFVAMNQQLGRIKGLENTSKTAPVMFGGGTLLTAAAAFMNPLLGLKLGGTLAANYGLGKLWTNPKFVRLATGYYRAMASGDQNAVKSQAGRLSKLAATNPELRAPIISLLQHIANDNAVPAVAASADASGNEQNQ